MLGPLRVVFDRDGEFVRPGDLSVFGPASDRDRGAEESVDCGVVLLRHVELNATALVFDGEVVWEPRPSRRLIQRVILVAGD